MKTGRRASFLIVAGLALFAGGCTASTAPAPAATVSLASTPRGDEGPSHVLHSEQLQGMMRVLRSTRADRWPQELEAGRRAEDAFHEIERAAVAVQVAAKELPATLPAWGLESGEREEFERKAAELGARAAALETAARRFDQRAVDREEEALDGACRACHARFRPGGDDDRLLH